MRKPLMVACATWLSLSACGASEHKAPAVMQKPTAAQSRAGDSSKICQSGELSVPNTANDPCNQTDASCVAAGGSAYASCDHGRWSAVCQCIVALPPPTITPPFGAAGRTAARTACGDGVVQEPEEQCDGKNLNGLTCKTLNYQGGGQLQCGPVCTVDTSLCRI